MDNGCNVAIQGDSLNILSLNINNFGGSDIEQQTNNWNSKEKISERLKRAIDIWAYIMESNAQIVVIQEFDNRGAVGKKFSKMLRISGFSLIGEKITGSIVKIAIRENIYKRCYFNQKNKELKAYAKWTEIEVELKNKNNLKIIGIHVPLADAEKRKQFKKELKNLKDTSNNTIVIGDFNAATNSDREKLKQDDDIILKENKELLKTMEDVFVDVWRYNNRDTKEFTWYNKYDDTGRRLDYAFVSCDLINKYSCEVNYDHDVNLSINNIGITDHSAINLKVHSYLKDIFI